MKSASIFLVLLLGAASILVSNVARSGHSQPNEDAAEAFMRAKLDAAQDVLEGLVNEDFKKIEQGAERMRIMSEQAQWHVVKTPKYRQYSNEFQHQTNRLADEAGEKSLDACALAYVELTINCVNCHKHARGVQIAEVLGLPGETGPFSQSARQQAATIVQAVKDTE